MTDYNMRMDLMVEAADGRDLCIQVEGAPDGPVILVHHFAPGSRRLHGPDVADAAAHGVRLVGWDRPGYGGSTRDEGRAVADAVADVRCIAAALGVERLAVAGVAAGGPFALACAALAPDLVAAVAGLGSYAPYGASGLDFFHHMSRAVVADLRRVLEDPEEADLATASQGEAILWASPEVLRKALRVRSVLLDDPLIRGSFADHMDDVLRTGLAPGAGGWIDDNRALLGPWGFDPSDIAVPTLLLHGRHDRFVPVAHGAWLAARIPGAEAELSATDAQLTLLGRWPEVRRWLLRHLA